VKRISLISIILFSGAAFANVIGTDAQNFNPTSNGVDFVTVQSGRTLDAGVLNFGLFFNYAANTLSFLEKADPKAVANRTKINDKLLSADLSVGYGLTKYLDVGLTLPYLLKQEIANDNQVAYFASTGNTEQRLNGKFKFYETESWANALVLTYSRNNIQDNPYMGRDPGPTTALEYATSWKVGESWFGFNFGHRWKQQGQSLATVFGIDPLPNMYVYSAAWSRMLASSDTKAIFEIFGSSPSKKNDDINLTERQQSTLEALAGIKHIYQENLALHAGAGTEISQGFGTPDWRIYVGLNWTMGPFGRKSVREETKKQMEATPKPSVQKFILSNLRFKFDSDELEEASLKEVEQVIEVIAGTPNVEKVIVEGHTDSSGKDDYNLRLSNWRAAAIKKMIVAKVPMSADKVDSKGYGESQPIADNSNYQGREKTRRVVVIVHSRSTDSNNSLIEVRLTE
jgi:outer membrane protein OmpA-like peptidoglycan-associated protein